MTFLHPELLWSLLALPLLVAAYLWLLRRPKVTTLRYSSVALAKQALGSRHAWARQLPPALLLMATAALLVASAGPITTVMLPTQQKTIILAMDVSLSMSAGDVMPNRLEAAQTAAKAFVSELPRNVKVGVVAFGSTAALVQYPTVKRDEVVASIEGLQLQRGTAIGSGIALAVATVFPTAGIDVSQARRLDLTSHAEADEVSQASAAAGTAVGSYPWAAVVLLTDGQRTVGPDPIRAAKLATEQGLRVYTVGLGTAKGQDISFDGWTVRVRLDEATLKRIADQTGAEYFNAGNAEDLMAVYRRLGSRFVLERTETEITALFAFLGAIFITLAATLSIRWFA